MSSNNRRLLLAAVAATVIALALVGLLARSTERDRRASAGGVAVSTDAVTGFAGAALPGDVRARGFALTDETGARISLASLHGQVAVLAFLSARCGAACVLIAQQIRGALDELAPRPPVLLVSVDPAGDTPARVSRFLAQASLTGRVHYLTGSVGALQPIWRTYGVTPPRFGLAAYERSPQVRLIDGSGRERVIFGLEQLTPEGLAHDVRRLRLG